MNPTVTRWVEIPLVVVRGGYQNESGMEKWDILSYNPDQPHGLRPQPTHSTRNLLLRLRKWLATVLHT